MYSCEKPDGEFAYQEKDEVPAGEKNFLLTLPVIRGVLQFSGLPL